MRVIQGQKKIIKSWCHNLEEGALDQARIMADLPFVHRHIVLLPDTHLGYGVPIGSVIACNGVIIPNAIGQDIGCGMCATKSNYSHKINKKTLKAIMSAVRKVVPMGVGKYRKDAAPLDMPKPDCTHTVLKEFDSACYQLGTLGAGNHFIELQHDESGTLWIMIHSGSRNLGGKIAKHYNKLAQDLNKLWHTNAPKDLAWLPVASQEGQDYIKDMTYATEFAFLSRQKMMKDVMEIVTDVVEKYEGGQVSFPFEMINVHHNYANLENHFGKNVWVHRKGATSAKKGELGIIPGSQGTNSYIVEGRGNHESFMSCSHGAGRAMGRKAAQKKLNLDVEIKRLDDIGVVHGIRNQKDLDEAAGAYKDIQEVITSQLDLIKVIHKLSPICCIKG